MNLSPGAIVSRRSFANSTYKRVTSYQITPVSFKHRFGKMLAIMKGLLIFLTILHFGRSKTINLNYVGSRIAGGTNATKAQFPYYAKIQCTIQSGSNIGIANCGGSVISPTLILTAAHCVEGTLLSTKIQLGYHKYDSDGSTLQTRTAKSIHIHPEYNATSDTNDVALIEVDKPITFTDFIKPIQISCNHTQPGTKTVIAGTGYTNDVDKKLSNGLRWINLTTVSNLYCKYVFSRIESTNICAVGNPKQGACQGDSGTALIKEENGTQVQIGVLSWGASVCEQGYPIVFARTSDYIDWIVKNANVSCVNESNS